MGTLLCRVRRCAPWDSFVCLSLWAGVSLIESRTIPPAKVSYYGHGDVATHGSVSGTLPASKYAYSIALDDSLQVLAAERAWVFLKNFNERRTNSSFCPTETSWEQLIVRILSWMIRLDHLHRYSRERTMATERCQQVLSTISRFSDSCIFGARHAARKDRRALEGRLREVYCLDTAETLFSITIQLHPVGVGLVSPLLSAFSNFIYSSITSLEKSGFDILRNAQRAFSPTFSDQRSRAFPDSCTSKSAGRFRRRSVCSFNAPRAFCEIHKSEQGPRSATCSGLAGSFACEELEGRGRRVRGM